MHGTSSLLFRENGANVAEPMLYIQTSNEVPQMAERIKTLSTQITGGPFLKIAVEDLCSWPMCWYLRDIKNAQIGFGPPMTLDKVRDFPVAITGYDNTAQPDHDQVVADSFSNSFVAYPIRFRRWWAPEKMAFFDGSFKDQLLRVWNLYMYRQPWMPSGPIRDPQFVDFVYTKGESVNTPYGTFDACVWVRKDIDPYFR
jgi:hypothetical protein